MNAARVDDPPARALRVISEQLKEATRAGKCHGCGCLHQTIAALEATEVGATNLSAELAAARATFIPKKYDCLGCPVCYPAIAANAFTEAFPSAGEVMDLCPTEAPSERSGWPPLPGSYTVLRFNAPVAVCTLNSQALVQDLAADPPDALSIVGTLSTENLGIERVIKNVLANPNIRFLVLCGEDTMQAIGHLPGQSFMSLFENGIDERGRIRDAKGKRPVLKNVTAEQVAAFRRQVKPVAMIGENVVEVITAAVRRCGVEAPGAFDGAPADVAVSVVRAVEPRRLVPDPAGYFVVYPDRAKHVLLVEHYTNAGVLDTVVEGTTPAAAYATIIEKNLISRLDHAAYLGRELARADHSLKSGEPYVQDRAPGELMTNEVTTACGCSTECGSTKDER